VVLGLARAFGAAGGAQRTLVFVLFGGEELGLLGSRHYVSHPPIPLTKTVAMLNFDMVGRMQRTRVTIAGGDSGRRPRAMARGPSTPRSRDRLGAGRQPPPPHRAARSSASPRRLAAATVCGWQVWSRERRPRRRDCAKAT